MDCGISVNCKNIKPCSMHDLYFNEPISSWDEAIPLGNGMSGCLIWGSGPDLIFSIDRGDLWDTRPAPQSLSSDYSFKKLIELVNAKDQQSIVEKFKSFYALPTPTKIPAGRLILKFPGIWDYIEGRLVLSNAVGDLKLGFGESHMAVRSFLHASEFVGYILIEGDSLLPEVEIEAHDFGTESPCDSIKNKGKYMSGALTDLGYGPAVKGEDGDRKWFVQKTPEGLEFGILSAWKKTGGKRLEIAYVTASSKDGEDWFMAAEAKIQMALEKGYDSMLESHAKWWEGFWNKSYIDLPAKDFEKQWYLTNYLFGSCSRKGCPPMPLQGIWTADEGSLPPWKGDYHNNLNLQMSYWHYMKANHLEEGESFIDFLWGLLPAAERFAAEFYDAPGICLPSIMSMDGKSLGGWAMYSAMPANQIWLCQAFDHYWRYTGDVGFLKERAYPYLKGTAECVLRWLSTNDCGKLRFPVSSSPEIHDNRLEAWVTPNSNYDLSLAIYLFKTLSRMSEVLGNGEMTRWDDILGRLPELAVNKYNALMLSPDEELRESHRHFAHAMAIYPLILLEYDRNERDKKIIDATVADLERLGSGLWVGYSFPWMAEFYARQGNGEGAAYQLKLFWECFCSKNGFHLNGDFKKRGISMIHYRPFTLEGNMCAADALQEMLLQTYNGIIRVFPAIPEEWAEKGVAFKNFRGEKGVLISAGIKDKKLKYIMLTAEKNGVFNVENKFDAEVLTIKADKSVKSIRSKTGDVFGITLAVHEECIIKAEGE